MSQVRIEQTLVDGVELRPVPDARRRLHPAPQLGPGLRGQRPAQHPLQVRLAEHRRLRPAVLAAAAGEPGQRAVSIELSSVIGAGGNIRPGDFVDVILIVQIKPEGDTRSQVVVMGRHDATLTATPWLERRSRLWPTIAAALDSLLGDFDRVVLEGAGSPVEVNGVPLNEPYVYQDDHHAFGPVTVPAGKLWLMGDHRNASYDSRYVGAVRPY